MNEECNDQINKCTSLLNVNSYITHTDKHESQYVSTSYERFEGNNFYYFYQGNYLLRLLFCGVISVYS